MGSSPISSSQASPKSLSAGMECPLIAGGLAAGLPDGRLDNVLGGRSA